MELFVFVKNWAIHIKCFNCESLSFYSITWRNVTAELGCVLKLIVLKEKAVLSGGYHVLYNKCKVCLKYVSFCVMLFLGGWLN